MRAFTKFVLLVDDDPADRRLFSHFLQKLGLEVIATGDADTAMQQIVAGNVGCVITDQTMRPSGHELLKLVKGVRSDIEIVFLSGADYPRQPLPPETKFISKQDRAALAEEVLRCMAPWRT